jgi:AraC-like DNA-binding protein
MSILMYTWGVLDLKFQAMLPVYRKITYSQLFSFSAILESPPEFDTAWHHHPEYELILILGSTGTRFMGDSIQKFTETELILIGPDLPHCWKEDQGSRNDEAKAYVIHFSADFLGKDFFNIPEGRQIKHLLEQSRLGLRFSPKIEQLAVWKILQIFETFDFDRVLNLLSLLNLLTKSETFEQISSPGFANTVIDNQSERINKVFEYTLASFKKPADLETVAHLAHMSKTAFCRFFRKSTGKTYFEFLKEIRLGHACKLLQESDLSIQQISYDCGYESMSNFNRQFKELIHTSPLKYRYSLAAQNSDQPLRL